MKMPSLQNRLLAALLPLILITVILAAVMMYNSIRNKVDELTGGQLVQVASVLKNLISHEIYEKGFQSTFSIKVEDLEFIYQSFNASLVETIVFQVWNTNNDLLIRSHGAPLTPLSDKPRGFSHTQLETTSWKVYSLPVPDVGITIQVAMEISFLDRIKGETALQSLIPIIAMLPILGLAIIYGVRSATVPLRKLSQDIRHRQPDNLDSIESENIPQEIMPLINAFNMLLGRVKEAITNERRFTDDAAHELRTPLAGIKLQAQLALKETDIVTRRRALNHLIDAVDRTTHLVQQLLVLARLTPEQASKDSNNIRLRDIAARSIADHYQLAKSKHIDIMLNDSDSGELVANPHFIAILINNLIQNAIQYTPEQGKVAVAVSREQDGSLMLSVSDSGPGIPEQERKNVLDRFYRVNGSGSTETPGCGLGLSIVRRICRLYHAAIELSSSELGGLRASIRFPAPASATPAD